MTKVLIVDDEMLMRKGLCTLIDWAALGCEVIGTAENGLRAKQVITSIQPDIVISDIKMPVVDGLALAKWVDETYPAIQMILLTAFADFSYARQAIQYGVTDYVTKNGDMSEIVSAVKRCKKQLKQQAMFQEGLKAQSFYLLKAILNGTFHSAQDITKQSGYENLQAKTYQVALVNAGKDHKNQQQAENLLRSFMSEDNLYLLPNGPHNFVLVFMDIPEKQVLSICANSTAMFQKLGSQTLYWGISNVIHQLFDLQEALAQAQQAISNRFYDKREIHLYQPSKPAKIPTYAAQFAALNRCLRSGDQAAGCEILSEIASLQKQKTQPEAQVKETARMILHLCRSALENYGTDLDALDIDEAQWTQELECAQFHHECMQLQTALFCSACQYVSQVLSEGNHLLASVQKYIDRHFCEALTLKDIAAAVHVSPGYLSRFFRQKTGKTIMDTITSKKIEYAKHLLEEQNLKIFEVAQRTGFEDTTYFSHVFKKYSGVSAKAYQEQVQRRREGMSENS